jgi:hypothetical protein
MDNTSIVNVHSTVSSSEAYFVRNMLEDADVKAQVVDDTIDTGGARLPLCRVWVAQSDAENARQCIQAWRSEHDKRSGDVKSEMWSCPNCGEQIEDQFDVCWQCQHARNTG